MSDLEKFKSDEAYYADTEYLSNSMLKLLRQSPTKFHLMREGKWSYPSASYFDVGTALHALFLEGIDKTILWIINCVCFLTSGNSPRNRC